MSTKFHLAVTTDGRVVEGLLTGGNANDITAAPDLVKMIVGCFLLADLGYDSDTLRRLLRENNNIAVIPGRKNRREEIAYDRERYKKRSYIERIFGKLKENRRLVVRYEKSDLNFLAFILLAFIKIGFANSV